MAASMPSSKNVPLPRAGHCREVPLDCLLWPLISFISMVAAWRTAEVQGQLGTLTEIGLLASVIVLLANLDSPRTRAVIDGTRGSPGISEVAQTVLDEAI